MQFIDNAETNAEDKRLRRAWSALAKEMPRAAVVQTMTENRDMCSAIFQACHENLQQRDWEDDRRYAKAEEIRIWAKMSLNDIRRLAKRKKKSSKFLAEVIRFRDAGMASMKLAA